MKNSIKIVTLFLVVTTLATSQNVIQRAVNKTDSVVLKRKHKRANKNFEDMSYMRAIEKYEKLLVKGYQNDSLKRYLARAYYNIGDTEKSELYFKEIVIDTPFVATDIYLLAQSLKYNKKYAEADRWISEYRKINNMDSRADIQYDNARKIKEILNVKRYNVTEVNFNSKESDFGPVVLDDRVVFATARNKEKIVSRDYAWNETPYLDIYSTKIDGGILEGTKLFSLRLTSSFHDGPAAFNAEGDEVFITRNSYIPVMPHTKTKVVEHIEVLNKVVPKKDKSGMNHLMIQYSKKDALGQWKYPETLSFCSPDYSCGHPSLAPDDSTLFFVSDMPGGFGGTDIYYVIRTDSGWTDPVNVGGEINTEGNEMFPFIHENGNLYFSSNGQLTLGGLDIFIAEKNEDSYRVKNMGYPLNSNKDDFSFYLEEDNINGYFASNREGGTGDDDIYRFEVLNPISFSLKLHGTVADSTSRHFINQALVSLLDENGLKLAAINTERGYEFNFEIEPEINYYVEVKRDDYYSKKKVVITSIMEIVDGVIELPVLLAKEPFYGIYGTVFQLPELTPISEVDLFLEAQNGKETIINTGQDGQFRTKLLEDMNYDLVFRKKNFFTKRVDYTTVGKDTGYVNLNEYIPQMGIEKAEVGKSIEIEILYDLGKWNIREDAAKELNDMVRFLKDNPTINIELGSHTDARGSARSNQILSQKRAESAVNYIVENGISSDRISAKGYGETKLKNRCADGVRCTEEEHQANRRSEAKITGM